MIKKYLKKPRYGKSYSIKKKLGNLRKKAEKQAHVKHPLPKQQTAAHLEHELNVHVIELEMQNDALMATQAKLNNSCKEYENLFDYSPVGYLTLDNKGVVSRLNKMASEQLGREKAIGCQMVCTVWGLVLQGVYVFGCWRERG